MLCLNQDIRHIEMMKTQLDSVLQDKPQMN
jgi:hypothetical protein